MKRLNCYIYTRVSTSMQVEGFSLDAQREKLRKYAEYQEMHIAGEYSDEGKISKYRIIISALKTEQYIRFVLPYEISDEYTEDMFREDLNDKIVHSIRMLQEISIYNSNRKKIFEAE